MIGALPPEILVQLTDKYPCRQQQIRSLSYFFSPVLPSSSSLVLHGPTATGKTSISRDILQNLGTPHALIDSAECLTGRHLFEQTVAACLDALEELGAIVGDRDRYARTESLSALKVSLERLLKDRGKFVLVFDGIDRQREAPTGLTAALARFTEYVPNLSVVFTTRDPLPVSLRQDGIAHLEFPAYGREEALEIIGGCPLGIDQASEGAKSVSQIVTEADETWLWTRFCDAVWDSQAKFVGRDIISFKVIASKLWRPFTVPIINGTYGPRDFSKLVVAQRMLFQTEDLLYEKVAFTRSSDSAVGRTSTNGPANLDSRKAARGAAAYEMPYYSKYLLCAAYLASYNPPRTDPIYFMKAAERKRRRRGAGAKPGRKPIHRKIPRRLLSPSPFTFERLLAIFRAILPHDDFKSSIDLHTAFATLLSLRLITKAGLSGDVLEPAAKFRVNVGWGFAQSLGRIIGLELGDWCFDG